VVGCGFDLLRAASAKLSVCAYLLGYVGRKLCRDFITYRQCQPKLQCLPDFRTLLQLDLIAELWLARTAPRLLCWCNELHLVIGVERFTNHVRAFFIVTLGAPEFMGDFPCYMTEDQLLQVVDVAMLMRARRAASCIQRQWRSYRQRRRAWALKVICRA
jgi:hypothetical protein